VIQIVASHGVHVPLLAGSDRAWSHPPERHIQLSLRVRPSMMLNGSTVQFRRRLSSRKHPLGLHWVGAINRGIESGGGSCPAKQAAPREGVLLVDAAQVPGFPLSL